MLAAGADINAKTPKGHTVLQNARTMSSKPLKYIEWLKSKGAKE